MKYNFLCLFMACALTIFGQTFKPVQINPFGINTDAQTYGSMQFADLTNDGLFDIVFETDFSYIMVNKGTPGAPDFTDVPYLDFFDYDENGVGSGVLTSVVSQFQDIDLDGDLDHVLNYYSDDPNFTADYAFERNEHEMTGGIWAFFFPEQTSATDIGLPLRPLHCVEPYAFGDLDADGDADILGWRIYELTEQANFVFYENVAGNAPMQFNNTAIENPFGLTAGNVGNGLTGVPAILDVDGDLDMDLLMINQYGDWFFYQNTGTPGIPVFGAPVQNPFGLTPVTSGVTVSYTLDINNDGFRDLICGSGNQVYYFEFEAASSSKEVDDSHSVAVFPNPATDMIHVNTGQLAATTIDLLFPDGKLLEHRELNGSKTSDISVKQLEKGLYLIRVTLEDGKTVVQKFVRD